MTMKLGMERKVCPEEDGVATQDEDSSTVVIKETTFDDKRLQAVETVEKAETRVAVESFDSATTTASGPSTSGDHPSGGDSNAEIGSVEVVVIPVHGGEDVGGGTTAADRSGVPSKPGEEQGIFRCPSSFSTDSFADCCRICQQHAEEPLIELGCHCRGELSRAHRSCIEQWFGNKGTNKCEICQHVAENVPAPPVQVAPHFWVWRLGINRGSRNYTQRRSGGARFHPLWAALLILIAGLLFDVLISIFLGASALPVNIIIGVLVVLGIGTAARLVVECWHERGLRRNIRRIETSLANLQGDGALQAQSNLVAQSAVRPLS
ncbi:uncharacterized protein LOC9641836 [Selaginella moellendorffii]|nr:uncharacterized protein LOC9641836 [Selaginella moellendorffii]|eukprot:XP_002971090.2 uncharacterized protein LOC9641836 [Selaginella moellendorffii]